VKLTLYRSNEVVHAIHFPQSLYDFECSQ
jgi:hypothetical protein